MVITEAWGDLTDADVLAHKARLLTDPAFDPAFGQLSDMRRVDRLLVTPAGVRAMVQHDTNHAERRSSHRMALLADSDVVYGMARMYQLTGGYEDGTVGVFRTLEEAEAWLNAPAPGGGRDLEAEVS